jgi:MFS family permease
VTTRSKNGEERHQARSGQNAARQVFGTRSFRLLIAGETISLIGDQFYLLALPWLVLQMTNSPLMVGAVTAVSAVPRAMFMLIGGALSDHSSPRRLMLASHLARMLVVACLAALTMGAVIRPWILFPLAFAFGIGDAFYFPARGAILPRLLPDDGLLIGNASLQATNQVAMFAGPVLAGTLVSLLHRARDGFAAGYEWGLGAAFAFDATTFLIAAVLLSLMPMSRPAAQPGPAPAAVATPIPGRRSGDSRPRLWASIGEGLKMAKADRFLRSALLLIGAGNLLITGPLYVGLPVLVATRYSGGAGALGIVLTFFGAGSLAGVGLAASRRVFKERWLPFVIVACPGVLGAGLILLGLFQAVAPAAGVAVVMGFAQGFVVVQFLTFLQRRTPSLMLGRVMSLLMFLVMGLAPLSSGFAGIFLEFSVSWLMIGAGGALIIVVGSACLVPSLAPFTRTPTHSLASCGIGPHRD